MLQSYIAPIKEVMPDFGDGFLAAALQHFSYNSEQVIHALLERALPPELKVLDTQMPLQLPSQESKKGSTAALKDNDKGKLPAQSLSIAHGTLISCHDAAAAMDSMQYKQQCM